LAAAAEPAVATAAAANSADRPRAAPDYTSRTRCARAHALNATAWPDLWTAKISNDAVSGLTMCCSAATTGWWCSWTKVWMRWRGAPDASTAGCDADARLDDAGSGCDVDARLHDAESGGDVDARLDDAGSAIALRRESSEDGTSRFSARLPGD
jgi:hypothetical protein